MALHTRPNTICPVSFLIVTPFLQKLEYSVLVRPICSSRVGSNWCCLVVNDPHLTPHPHPHPHPHPRLSIPTYIVTLDVTATAGKREHFHSLINTDASTTAWRPFPTLAMSIENVPEFFLLPLAYSNRHCR